MNAKAHEVIEVPDYRSSFPHHHVKPVRADEVVKGDYLIEPDRKPAAYDDGRTPIVGLTYEVMHSGAHLTDEGVWVIMASAAQLTTWKVAHDERFFLRLPHDAQTCPYCTARFAAAQQAALEADHRARLLAQINWRSTGRAD